MPILSYLAYTRNYQCAPALKALLSYYWNAAERSILSVHSIIATHMSMALALAHGYGNKGLYRKVP